MLSWSKTTSNAPYVNFPCSSTRSPSTPPLGELQRGTRSSLMPQRSGCNMVHIHIIYQQFAFHFNIVQDHLLCPWGRVSKQHGTRSSTCPRGRVSLQHGTRVRFLSAWYRIPFNALEVAFPYSVTRSTYMTFSFFAIWFKTTFKLQSPRCTLQHCSGSPWWPYGSSFFAALNKITLNAPIVKFSCSLVQNRL